MAVRGTAEGNRNKVLKHVIVRENNDHEGERIWCAWADCDRYGFECFQTVINEAKPGFAKKLARYVFCCARHQHYFETSHIPGEYGRLRGENPRFR